MQTMEENEAERERRQVPAKQLMWAVLQECQDVAAGCGHNVEEMQGEKKKALKFRSLLPFFSIGRMADTI